ncbi:unnamed protein product [Penicillium salamii]|nr:unnamed protein product [Penicillium salamii]CAG8429981.1 unnamed protein product [Penicillium salamii]
MVVIFGPQCSLGSEAIVKINHSLAGNVHLQFLLGVLKDLPSLWESIIDAYPELVRIPGLESLTALAHLFEESNDTVSSPGIVSPAGFTENVILTPLTVVSHLLEYWNLNEGFPASEIVVPPEVTDVQGFCVGFLPATVVACTRDINDFKTMASATIRLAVCIGALVDLDQAVNSHVDDPEESAVSIAVRWKSEDDFEYFQRSLASSPTVSYPLAFSLAFSPAYISCFTDANTATVTASGREATLLTSDLQSNSNISAKLIDLRGRFHHNDHKQSVEKIIDLCERDGRFRLPSAKALHLPLRSNVDGQAIPSNVALHTVALESILVHQCQWFKTISASLQHRNQVQLSDRDNNVVKGDEARVISIGTGSFLPRSSKISNGQSNGQPARDTQTRPKLANGYHREANGDTDLNTPSSSPTVDSVISEKSKLPSATPIAIIGMACRYADADSVDELWEVLELGKCAVKSFPTDRINFKEFSRDPKGPFWGNFLRNADAFDHRFFNISGREAKTMDPQQRLLLEVAYEAVESSGYCGLRSREFPSDVGCYLGVGAEDYSDNISSHPANAFSATGMFQAFNSGRISHHFGWTGPSVTLDTACSSATVAIHHACKAIQGGDCSSALAGGVNVMTSPKSSQNLAAASFTSPTGASRAFDENANGYCRGEGAGLVMLRPLADAIEHGDPILGIITGSAVNQGSNRSPITVPDAESLKSLYQRALSTAGIEPEQVSYVEAHGTGTQVGDPVEMASICKTFGGQHRRDQVYVGSIKDNIGHTESSSGAAGLLKSILMMQKKMIVKQANFTRLNPKIAPLDQDKVIIPTRLTEWTHSHCIAMVNNYGAAGSNAALVVEQYQEEDEGGCPPSLTQIPIFISARTRENLEDYCNTLKDWLAKNHQSPKHAIQDIGYNLVVKQNRDMEFSMTFVSSPESAHFSTEMISEMSKIRKSANKTSPAVVLCFGGQNGRTASISKDLYTNCPLLKWHLDNCERTCEELDLPRLYPMIFSQEPIEDIVRLHCQLFAVQYACAKSWIDCGIKVDRLIGHSFGQLTALCVSGSLTLSDGMYLISQRAKLIRDSWGPERGAMLSVECSDTELSLLIDRAQQRYSSCSADIACVNSKSRYVVSGTETCIEAIEETISTEARTPVGAKRLENTHGFHSRLVDSITEQLEQVAQSLHYRPPSIPVEGCCATDEPNWSSEMSAKRIVDHSRGTVYFQSAVQKVAKRLEAPQVIWLEAGPGSSIIPMIRRVLEDREDDEIDTVEHVYQRLDLKGHSRAQTSLANATCNLWSKDVRVQYWPFQRARGFNWINLPPYQFTKTRHWMELKPTACPPGDQTQGTMQERPSELLHLVETSHGKRVFRINTQHDLYRTCVSGHAVLDQNLCPASLYVELATRAATLSLSDPQPPSIPYLPNVKEMEITAPLVLDPVGNLVIQLTGDEDTGNKAWSFSVSSCEMERIDATTVHASGKIALLQMDHSTSAHFRTLNRLINQSLCDRITNSATSIGYKGSIAVYKAMESVVNYANFYRGVQSIYAVENEAVGRVSLAPQIFPRPDLLSTCQMYPILMDNFVQVAGVHVNCLLEHEAGEVFVCTATGEISVNQSFMEIEGADRLLWMVYTNCERQAKSFITSDIFVLDPRSNALMISITGVSFRGVSLRSLRRTLTRLNSNTPSRTGGPHAPAISEDTQIAAPVKVQAQAVSSVRVAVKDQKGSLQDIQEMLSELIGVPIEEIFPSSTFDAIGIDSLMTTELVTEVQKRFNVQISNAQLENIDDVRTLAEVVLPTHSTVTAVTPLAKASISREAPHTAKDMPSIEKIRGILNEVLDVPIDEISPSSLLTDLGVDSLVATELLSEFKKQLDLEMTAEEFQTKTDVASLSDSLQECSSNSKESPEPGPEMPLVPIAYDCFVDNTKSGFDSAAKETHWLGFYSSLYPQQHALVTAYVVEAFRTLGFPLDSFSPGQPVPHLPVSKCHEKLRPQLYAILEASHLISIKQEAEQNGDLVRTDKPVPTTSSQTLHAAIIDQNPAYRYDHELLHVTGSRLAECLTGQTDPLSLLFQNAQARQLMSDFYTYSPALRSGTVWLGNYLAGVIQKAGQSLGREVKILELGAGTGGTTDFLLTKIIAAAAAGIRFHYTFTDISPSLVAMGRRRFSQYKDFMTFTTLDVEKEPPSSMLGQYDIVLSSNCIHATKNLVNSCTAIQKLLRPDGILCLIELTRNILWYDLVFGLLEGWWLFNDGRKHALANEFLWQQNLRQAGFEWIDWTDSESLESDTLRVIVASPSPSHDVFKAAGFDKETVVFGHRDGNQTILCADIYYPKADDTPKHLPIALLIHGGGHVMLSRRVITQRHIQDLLDFGFLPVSIDYRLCPETSLVNGPMQDVCEALNWARNTLPDLPLVRSDIRPCGDRVVAVGWSTGGHLAMTLAWTAKERNGLQPPNAILAFYCPTDYEDSFWSKPNFPFASESPTTPDLENEPLQFNLLKGMQGKSLTAYKPPVNKHTRARWMFPGDPRSQILLQMNWKGQTLPVLLNGSRHYLNATETKSQLDPSTMQLPTPSEDQIKSVSPFAQIQKGCYRSPTFIIHGTLDDLIPWQQSQQTYDALIQGGHEAQLRLVKDSVHLFDIYPDFPNNAAAVKAVSDGFEFLRSHVS